MNNKVWIPAYAGMTNSWIPAFAGMTAIVLLLLALASPALAGDVTVIGYNCHRTSTGKYLVIKGSVHNYTGHAVKRVEVIAICNTWSEDFVDANNAYVKPRKLDPDREGAFTIKVPYNSEIDRDKIIFQTEYKDAEQDYDTPH